MAISVQNLEEALGQILSKTGVTDVKNVLGTYDQAKSVKENLRLLLNHKKDILLETVNFLKTLSTEYPVPIQQINSKSYLKEDYANDIISFLNLLKPTQCLSCSQNYVPTGDDFKENEVKCLICKRPSHHNCYKDSSVNPKIGIVFLCSECLSEKTAKNIEETDKLSPETPAKSSTAPHRPSKDKDKSKCDTNEDDSDSDDESTDKTKKEKKKSSSGKDCPLYLKRICPHGLTGKRHVNGKPCPDQHRKHCRYFMEYGPSGCRFKGQCRYLHPRLCENSVKLKTCLNKSCTEFHLKGTQRKPPPPNSEPAQQPTQQPTGRYIQPWSLEKAQSEIHKQNSTVPTTYQHSNSSNEDSTKDFLEKYLQQIKADLTSFTKSLIEDSLKTNLSQLAPNSSQNRLSNEEIFHKTIPNQMHHQQPLSLINRQSFV